MNKQAQQPVPQAMDHRSPATATDEDCASEVALRKTLPSLRRCAPDGLADRVMVRIADRPARTGRNGLLIFGRWAGPAAAGAAAAGLVMLGLRAVQYPVASTRTEETKVHFVFYAPGAQKVELVGDFTDWRDGLIHLKGPDASGRWAARVALPEGRYEYMFLVDGQSWRTDPLAQIRRSDGFGNLNAVMNL